MPSGWPIARCVRTLNWFGCNFTLAQHALAGSRDPDVRRVEGSCPVVDGYGPTGKCS